MSKKIAVLITDDFEDSEFTSPAEAFKLAGHQVITIEKQAGKTVKGKQGEAEVAIDRAIDDVTPGEFDALLLPGGYSPDMSSSSSLKVIRDPLWNTIRLEAGRGGAQLDTLLKTAGLKRMLRDGTVWVCPQGAPDSEQALREKLAWKRVSVQWAEEPSARAFQYLAEAIQFKRKS